MKRALHILLTVLLILALLAPALAEEPAEGGEPTADAQTTDAPTDEGEEEEEELPEEEEPIEPIDDLLRIAFADELEYYETLQQGDKKDAVSQLKGRMYELGYFNSPSLDANYSETTTLYVRQFQQINHLEETGIATPEMQALLYSDFALGKNGQMQSNSQVVITEVTLASDDFDARAFVKIVNRSSQLVEAFTLHVRMMRADGTLLYGFTDLTTEEPVNTAYSFENVNLRSGSSITLNNKTGSLILSEVDDIVGVQVAIASYRFQGGAERELRSDYLTWYGTGEGFPQGETLPSVAPTTLNEEIRSATFRLGYTTKYFDSYMGKAFSLPDGSFITSVTEGGMADEAGLQPGDILMKINDTIILGSTTTVHARALVEPGDTVTFTYFRDGSTKTGTAVRPADGTTPAAPEGGDPEPETEAPEEDATTPSEEEAGNPYFIPGD